MKKTLLTLTIAATTLFACTKDSDTTSNNNTTGNTNTCNKIDSITIKHDSKYSGKYELTYNKIGLVDTMKYFNGKRLNSIYIYTFDSKNQLTELNRSVIVRTQESADFSFEYNSEGQIIKTISDFDSTTSYINSFEYDNSGFLIKSMEIKTQNSRIDTNNYSYSFNNDTVYKINDKSKLIDIKQVFEKNINPLNEKWYLLSIGYYLPFYTHSKLIFEEIVLSYQTKYKYDYKSTNKLHSTTIDYITNSEIRCREELTYNYCQD